MTGFVLLATLLLAGDGPPPPPCVPVAFPTRMPSAIEDHRTLRTAIGEPMPRSPTMALLHGKGGHLSTEEYSIVLVRAADGAWRGTAVGRSRIWVTGAPYVPMRRAKWALDAAAGRRLDAAISRRCPSRADASPGPADTGPPPRGFVSERIDIMTPGHAPITFPSEGEGGIAVLLRPPG